MRSLRRGHDQRFPRGWHDVPAVSAIGSLAGDPEREHAPRVGSPPDNGAGKQCPLVCSGDPCPAAGLGAVLRKTDAAAVTLWIPGYFCYPVLSLVRQLPVRCRFYSILEDLSPDWDRIYVERARTKLRPSCWSTSSVFR